MLHTFSHTLSHLPRDYSACYYCHMAGKKADQLGLDLELKLLGLMVQDLSLVSMEQDLSLALGCLELKLLMEVAEAD